MSSHSDFLDGASDHSTVSPASLHVYDASAPSQSAGTDGVTKACAYGGPYQFSTNDQRPWQAWHPGPFIWNVVPVDEPSASLTTPPCFQTHPGSLDISPSASKAWNFTHSTLDIDSYPPWNQPPEYDSWIINPDGQSNVPLLTGDPFLLPAQSEAQFDFTFDTALPQLNLAPPLASSMAPASVLAQRITCSVDGCGRSFVRAGDCRRHMLKHGPPKFKCAVIECDMTFHRADKLRAHMKQGHKIRL